MYNSVQLLYPIALASTQLNEQSKQPRYQANPSFFANILKTYAA